MSAGGSATSVRIGWLKNFWNSISSPSVIGFMITWIVITAGATTFHSMTIRTSDKTQRGLSSTQSSLGDLERRVGQSDSSAVGEIEALRKRVEDFDRLLAAQRGQSLQFPERADEVKSRQAVERAQAAVLQAEVATARDRLQKLKDIHATWTARHGSLLSGDLGKPIAASPTHLDLVTSLLSRVRPTDADLLRWDLQLEALAGPVQAARQEGPPAIAITTEHTQMINDLSHQVTTALVGYDQQNILLEAVLRETSSVPPAEPTLENKLKERLADVERKLTQKLAKARDDARTQAETVQAERLAKLESQIVAVAGQAQEEALLAKTMQAAQIAKSELKHIEENTKVKEVEINAERIRRPRYFVPPDPLEPEFERDLPEIKSLLSAFVTGGFKYRSTTDKGPGPASLAHIASQHGLELTPTGSYAMSYLANCSDRPAGGLKNPPNPERIHRAQHLPLKYGKLMVQKKMLEP